MIIKNGFQHRINKTFGKAFDWILPYRCGLCREVSNAGFCSHCKDLLPWIASSCFRCGTPLPNAVICGNCQNTPHTIHHSVIPFLYQPPISDLIHKLKYHGQLDIAPILAKALAEQIHQQYSASSYLALPDIIVSIPIHWKKYLTRGFNQSGEIATQLGRTLDIPVANGLLKKYQHTPSQTGLDMTQRMKNNRNAFRVKTMPLSGHIALLDDVVTTGSTTRYAAKALLKAGAASVSVWAIAKT